MKGIKNKRLCLIFLLLFCLTFNSCKISENILQSSSEVDFSIPQKVQISYNEHIYDTVIVFKNSKLEMNFKNEKDLMNGAYISLDSENYKITYSNMAFEGSASELSDTFLPCIVYCYISSFDSGMVFESFDEQKGCYYIKKDINSYFVVLEAYNKDDKVTYSMEIK